MEKRLNKKYNTWIATFKTKIRDKITILDRLTNEESADFLQFIYDYPTFALTKEDLQKRKRVKNTVPYHERCCALRANLEQCTRRRKGDNTFCGTHIKGIPHGEINGNEQKNQTYKIKIWAEEVEGIISHLDKFGNVYDPQDIHQNIKNPKIIAKYTKNEGDVYKFKAC